MIHEPFKDRADAGRRLAQALSALDLTDPVVLALPRGGVPVATEVARVLRAPIDLLLVRKIGAPMHPEVAIAAVAEGLEPTVEIDHETLALSGASVDYVYREVPSHLDETGRRRRVYLQGRAPLPVEGKTVVLVDDRIATGTSVRAALCSLRRRKPARIVLAVPVAPQNEVARLRAEVDDLVCLATPASFDAVGSYYRDFEQATDDQVVALMEEFR
jgi:putative phosphoribosyl transferase